MKKNYDLSSVAYSLFVEEHIGLADMGKNPEYESELQDAAYRYLKSVFFCPEGADGQKRELMAVMAKYKPSTVSPYLVNFKL